MLVVTLFISLGPAAYFLVEKVPSTTCSPFRNLTTVFAIITKEVDKASPLGKSILTFIGSPSFMLGAVGFALYVSWNATSYRAIAPSMSH